MAVSAIFWTDGRGRPTIWRLNSITWRPKNDGYPKSKSVTAVTVAEAGARHAAWAVDTEALMGFPVAAEAGRSVRPARAMQGCRDLHVNDYTADRRPYSIQLLAI
jgi:hypothetical protein